MAQIEDYPLSSDSNGSVLGQTNSGKTVRFPANVISALPIAKFEVVEDAPESDFPYLFFVDDYQGSPAMMFWDGVDFQWLVSVTINV
jgi:hypothetical protein